MNGNWRRVANKSCFILYNHFYYCITTLELWREKGTKNPTDFLQLYAKIAYSFGLRFQIIFSSFIVVLNYTTFYLFLRGFQLYAKNAYELCIFEWYFIYLISKWFLAYLFDFVMKRTNPMEFFTILRKNCVWITTMRCYTRYAMESVMRFSHDLTVTRLIVALIAIRFCTQVGQYAVC